MKNLEITEENAQAAFKEADEKSKPWLARLFGWTIPKKNKWDEIESYEDACANLGRKPLTIEDFPEEKYYEDAEYEFNRHKASVIAKAIKEDEVIDWSDDKPKWRGWFTWDKKSGGFGFSFSDYFNSGTYSNVGSRHHFLDEKKSDYYCIKFIELHKKILTHN